VGATSCFEPFLQVDSEEERLPDSLASKSVFAAFRNGQDLNLFFANTSDTILYQYFHKGMVLADTLTRLGTDTFFSSRFKTTYVLLPDLVECVHEQKIIHPSSNWQGQAPWKELHRFEYARIDCLQ